MGGLLCRNGEHLLFIYILLYDLNILQKSELILQLKITKNSVLK